MLVIDGFRRVTVQQVHPAYAQPSSHRESKKPFNLVEWMTRNSISVGKKGR